MLNDKELKMVSGGGFWTYVGAGALVPGVGQAAALGIVSGLAIGAAIGAGIGALWGVFS